MHERLVRGLEDPQGGLGMFWLQGGEDDGECQGILRWDPERGAEVRLLDPPLDWPIHEINAGAGVRGILSDGPSLLMPSAYVGRHHRARQTDVTLRSAGLLLGMEGEAGEGFSRMRFRTAHMHEWLGATGLKTPDYDYEGASPRRVGIEWSPVEPLRLNLGEAEITLSIGLSSNADFSPDQSFATNLNLRVKPEHEMPLDELERRFQRPLVVFSTLVADRWDSVGLETIGNERHRLDIQVLHAGRTVKPREWQPDDEFLFRAVDCGDARAVLRSWFDLYARAGLPFAVFAETLRDDAYYPGRLIQSVSALEGYCSTALGRGETFVKTLKRLRDHCGIDPAVNRCSDENLALIAAARNYYTHLEARGGRDAGQLEGHLVECCRWCTALLHSCLLRELGFSKDRTEELLERHYLSWPLPQGPKRT